MNFARKRQTTFGNRRTSLVFQENRNTQRCKWCLFAVSHELNHLKSLGKFRGIGNVFYLMNYLKTAQVRQLKLEEIFGLKLNREETYYFLNFFPNPRKIS